MKSHWQKHGTMLQRIKHARFIKDDIVVIPFLFSNLSGSKRRPAYVITKLPGNDILLCQITSKTSSDKFSIPLSLKDFSSGTLLVESTIRIAKLFTADKSIIKRKAGSTNNIISTRFVDAIVALIKS